MSAEIERPQVSKDPEGNLVIPPNIVEIKALTDKVAHDIMVGAIRYFDGKPNGFAGLRSCIYFAESLRNEINWAINHSSWKGITAYLPENEVTFEVIGPVLVDRAKLATSVDAKHLGHGIKSLSYLPTVLPSIWIREHIMESDQNTYAVRTLFAQEAIQIGLDLANSEAVKPI